LFYNPNTYENNGMLNYKQIDRAISEAEQSFRDCWLKLMTLRKGGNDVGEMKSALVSFQPTLGTALYKLESLYNAVCKEASGLARRKSDFNPKWLRRRTQTLIGYKHLIQETVDVGKVLGDSFAWIFYKNSHELLRKHHEQQSNPHPPTGTGGRGEIEFVRRMPRLGRHFVLAHSITTFLRLGDVSFIDLEGYTVDAIGELKTKAEGDTKLLITLILVGPKPKRMELPQPPVNQSGESPPADPLPPQLLERLNRQLERMEGSFAPPDKNRMLPPFRIEDSPLNYSKLAELYRRSSEKTWGHIKADRGLLIVGLKRRGDSLYKRLTAKSAAINNRNLSRVGQATKEILDSSLQDNGMHLGWLVYPPRGRYILQLGMQPVFWWRLGIDVIEALLFKRFMAMSIYNPAFLMSDLRSSGLEVVKNASGEIQIWKPIGERRYEVRGVPYFLGLVQKHLIPDKSVVNIICKFVEAVEKADFKHPASVDMHLDFAFD
jgi:hypothetical protein